MTPKQMDPDVLSALTQFSERCWHVAETHGFHAPHILPGEVTPRRATFGERITLVMTELAETYEEYRAGHGMDEIYYSDGDKPEGIPIELADVLIRLGDLIHEHGIPIARAVAVKDRYNQTRSHMHGKKI